MPTPRPLTPQDVFNFKVISDAQISPDGDVVAFVVGDAYTVDSQSPKSQVWLVNADGSDARPFTSGPRTDRHPRWSPDGQWLACLSDRLADGHDQLYVMPRSGGEARRIADTPGDHPTSRSTNNFQWSADGKAIAFLMKDSETEAEKQRKESKDDVVEFEKSPKFWRVWTVDVASGSMREASPPDCQVWEFDWSPDGSQLALVVSDAPQEWGWYQTRLAIAQAMGGELKTIFDPAPRQIARPAWSPDGQSLALITSTWSDRGVVSGDLLVLAADGGAPRNLTGDYAGSVSWVEWTPNSRSLIAVAYYDGQVAFEEFDAATASRRQLWAGPVALSERFWPHFSRDRGLKTIAVAREDQTHPRDVWLMKRGSTMAWTQLTRLHPQADELQLGEMRELRWRSVDGQSIQGLLALPVNHQPGQAYPLLVWVHGGPTSLYPHGYYGATIAIVQTMTARGWAVLLPNPRGSVGWGMKFTEANLGDMGGQDFADIMSGVDYCIDTGVADEDRLAIGGWSYGGFMTAWAITQADCFKAAVVGAGITDWLSFHGTSHLTAWDAIHYRADPYEAGGTYHRFSPITHIARVRTPTLIVHGEKDPDVPVGQGYEFFRALKDHGVPVEMLVYPREEHGFLERRHQVDWIERAAAWLERWVTGR